MKSLTALFALLSLTVPSHAASPRACRTATSSCAGRIRVVATAQSTTHHAAKSNLVITAFAVPVAVPVAPFAPYWYGVSDYHHASSWRGPAAQTSYPGSAWGRTAPEALPPEPAREVEPRSSAFRDKASERERSLIAQRCISCHGRTSPKQGLTLVDPLSLSPEDRLRAIRTVIHGEMPPDTEPPLTDADRAALLRELTAE